MICFRTRSRWVQVGQTIGFRGLSGARSAAELSGVKRQAEPPAPPTPARWGRRFRLPTRTFYEIPRAEGPSQQTTKTDRPSHKPAAELTDDENRSSVPQGHKAVSHQRERIHVYYQGGGRPFAVERKTADALEGVVEDLAAGGFDEELVAVLGLQAWDGGFGGPQDT